MTTEVVGRVDDFPEGEVREVSVAGRKLAIYRVDGELHALDGICPHQEIPLHLAPPREGRAICQGHGWEFDLRTGQCLRGQKRHRVAVYPVHVEGENVVVEVS